MVSRGWGLSLSHLLNQFVKQGSSMAVDARLDGVSLVQKI